MIVSDPVSGHYPGAISIPVPESVIDAEHNCFKGKEDLLKGKLWFHNNLLIWQFLGF